MAEEKQHPSRAKKRPKKNRSDADSPTGARIKRLKKKGSVLAGRTLYPEEISVSRVEFSGSDTLVFGRPTQPDVLNDGDPTDDIYIFDWPPGDADEVIQLPWPPGTEPD